MHNVPHEFRSIPEARRLREAQSHFDAAIEREKVLSAASGEKVRLVSASLQEAQRELQQAEDAFDAATGLPQVVPLTKSVLEEIPKHFPPDQCQNVVGILERRCGRTIPFMREATAFELEPYRLSVLRRSKGDMAELNSWIEFANRDGRNVLL
jgi:hypothetical protein